MDNEFNAKYLGRASGYMQPEEIDYLKELVRSLPDNPRVVNIGAGRGSSGMAMAESRPDVHITTIDICQSGPIGSLDSEKNAFSATSYKVPDEILGDSKDVGKKWDRGMLDLIFVDGDHSRNGVRGDIEAWMGFVKPSGIIVFHDCDDPGFPEVRKAVDELIAPFHKLIGQTHYTVAFRISPAKPAIKRRAKNVH